MSRAEPTSSAEIKKELLRREKAALEPLGFRHLRGDIHTIRLAEDWEGSVGLHKRAATGPALMVYIDAVSVVLDHLPTRQLMRELHGRGPEDPGFIILGGGHFDVPSDDTRYELMHFRPTDLEEIDAAIGRWVRTLEEEALPWMRRQADIDTLAASLAIPHASPGMESGRLETLATVHYLRRDKVAALAALDTLRQDHMPCGIPLIDEPRERFWNGLRARVDRL